MTSSTPPTTTAAKTNATTSTTTSPTTTSVSTISTVKTSETNAWSTSNNTNLFSNNSTTYANITLVGSSPPGGETGTKSTSELTGAAVGGSLAAVVIVSLIILTIIVLVRRRRRTIEKSESDCEPTEPQTVKRTDLGNECYINVLLKDRLRPSLDMDTLDPATDSNSHFADKHASNTDTYYLQKDVPVKVRPDCHNQRDVPVIITPNEDTSDSLRYENFQDLQIDDTADIRFKKSNLLSTDSETNNPYTSLRSQTSDTVNQYNTFGDFDEKVQESDHIPPFLGDRTSAKLKLGKGELDKRSVLDSSIPVNYSMSSNFLDTKQTIEQQNEYGNSAYIEEKIGQKSTKTDKKQRKKAAKNKHKSDVSHSSLPIKKSADEDDVNVYKNINVYNNL